MNDDLENKRRDLNQITGELNDSRLSRRGLLDRLKGLGVAFGAAFMLGTKESDAHNAPDATARLKSTNTALNNIIEEEPEARPAGKVEGAPEAEDRPIQTAYHRVYRRFYRRVYNRY